MLMERFTRESCKRLRRSLYLCAAGFEDRVKGVPDIVGRESGFAFDYSIILEYLIHQDHNRRNLAWLEQRLPGLSDCRLPNAVVDIDNLLSTRQSLMSCLERVSADSVDEVYVDISGMANFLILEVLKLVEASFPGRDICVLYTEARDYFPKKHERQEILTLAGQPDDRSIMKLGSKLQATGAREILIPMDFRGSFREDLPTALIFIVGYEPSRALGLLDSYRPDLVIPCYGDPPSTKLKWRRVFSRQLHDRFQVFGRYPHTSPPTTVSTFYPDRILKTLEKLYESRVRGEVLYDSCNVAISPQCSKLQAVVTYEFCKMHPDVQVVFCLPGQYNPRRYSAGIGASWLLSLRRLENWRRRSRALTAQSLAAGR